MNFNGVKITWLGHATFLLKTPEGRQILVDPWLSGNPVCPEEYHDVEADAILVTHGHADHIGDLVEAAGRSSGPVVGIFELTTWLGTKGIGDESLEGMNKGGTIQLEDLGVSVTMTDAHHSSSFVEEGGDLVYLGEPAGFVVTFSNDTRIYIAGDTCLFGDMEWIRELYEPELAILPIGDRFTMDPEAAAHACHLLGVEAVIPCHYATFPLLTGTSGQFQEALAEQELDVEMFALEPGES